MIHFNSKKVKSFITSKAILLFRCLQKSKPILFAFLIVNCVFTLAFATVARHGAGSFNRNLITSTDAPVTIYKNSSTNKPSGIKAAFELNSPWVNTDIGAVGIAGSAGFSNGTFTVKGAGFDFWNAPDNFHFVYQPISGNTTLIARIASIQNTSNDAKAGIMIRENLTENASFVATVVHPTARLLMSRQGTGKPAYLGKPGSAPLWVKLVRSGNSFTSSYSENGTSWTQFGAVNISMNTTVYVGLVVTSHNMAVLNTSTFDNVSVTSAPAAQPSVTSVIPANGATNVNIYSSISTSVLQLPNGGIDNATLDNTSVKLLEANTNVQVPASINGTGGRDGITLVPGSPLKPYTKYRFEITSGVKDLTGVAFKPYASTFTTGNTPDSENITAKFKKVTLNNTTDRHTSLAIGPDGKLYGLTIDGRIKRYTINTDGTLGTAQVITSLQNYAGGKRLTTGFVFDPSATADNLVCYVSHHTFVFEGGPEWDGKIARLNGANLEKVQNIVINLPRSAKDHLTHSLAFGPDRAMYFTVGSNSAIGRADGTWGNRTENLLSAAILRLNMAQLSSLPINAKTSEGSGTYNPYAASAPLTIYASGIRNAYDLLWHSNGQLYVPTNGSNPGGNTPASVNGTRRPDGTLYNGPSVPALTKVLQTQYDYLFRITKGGYYGHPNPRRGEYVLNGGNPTSGADRAQVDMYPVGVKPDANYRGFSYDFANNKSPNGVIEYKSDVFEGALKGKILVVRYSQKNDIIVLEPGINKDISKATEGYQIPGFSNFRDPLDLVEDTRNGNIYVAEYEEGGTSPKLTLLKPDLSSTTSTTARMYSAIDEKANAEIYDGIGVLNFRKDFFEVAPSEEGLSINPNPAVDQAFLTYTGLADSREINIKIFNASGVLVQEQKLTYVHHTKRQTILDTHRLTPGRYVILVIDGDKKFNTSFIKP